MKERWTRSLFGAVFPKSMAMSNIKGLCAQMFFFSSNRCHLLTADLILNWFYEAMRTRISLVRVCVFFLRAINHLGIEHKGVGSWCLKQTTSEIIIMEKIYPSMHFMDDALEYEITRRWWFHSNANKMLFVWTILDTVI